MKKVWSVQERERLGNLRLDPIQSSPEKLRELAEHFSKVGASVFAVTEGGSGIHVSRGLARKVRDLTAAGKLDWLLESKTLGDAAATEVDALGPWVRKRWKSLIAASEGYLADLPRRVQSAQIHIQGSGGIDNRRYQYGAEGKALIRGLLRRDTELATLEEDFKSALDSGDIAAARDLIPTIRTHLEELHTP